MRDAATACCVLRDAFREAFINSKNFRFAVGFCAYGICICHVPLSWSSFVQHSHTEVAWGNSCAMLEI